MIVVSDTSPITNLAAIGQLDLLQKLYTHIVIPEGVYNEMVAVLLLMDERRGRIVATSYRLQVTGLLGVLIQAKHNNLVEVVQPLIDQLIEKANFRVSGQLYTTVLQIAGEF